MEMCMLTVSARDVHRQQLDSSEQLVCGFTDRLRKRVRIDHFDSLTLIGCVYSREFMNFM